MFNWFKEKDLQELQTEVEKEFAIYKEKVKNITGETLNSVGKLNSIISVINSERNFLRDEIYSLHKFLSLFEDMGKRLSPFDFAVEPFLSGNYFNAGEMAKDADEALELETQNYDNLTEIVASGGAVAAALGAAGAGAAGAGAAGVGVTGLGAGAAFTGTMGVKAALATTAVGAGAIGIGTAMVVGGIILAPVGAAGYGIYARNENKKKITELTELLGMMRTDWAEKITKLENYRDFICRDAPRIAEIYRECIALVRDSVKYNIVPEIQAVRCFFTADAIKENIKYDQKTTNIRPNPVSMYKDTSYHKHYLFVKNSYDFYAVTHKFFTKAVLSEILTDITTSSAVQKKLEEGIAEVREKLATVTENIMFSEGNKNV
jgi:hypothetical protein